LFDHANNFASIDAARISVESVEINTIIIEETTAEDMHME